MNDLTLFAKALADPTRVRVLVALRQGEACVGELADAMEVSPSTLSNHLQVIRHAGLVVTRRNGKWTYYSLEPKHLDVVAAVFAHYQADLSLDLQIQRDAQRLQKRFES